MRFEARQNNSYENIEDGRQKGVWTDHTTQGNRYQDLLNAVSDRAEYQGDEEINILDIGCSTGEAAEYFADEVERMYGVEVNVTGVDVSDEILEEADQRLDETYQQPAQDLDFDSNSFDIVTSKTLLSRISPEDQTQAMREINRVVDDGYAAVQVDPQGQDRVITGTSYVMTGEEMNQAAEATEEFSDYSIADELEPHRAVNYQPESEPVEDVEKHKDGEFLGATRHLAEQADSGSNEGSDDDIIVA